MDKQIQEIPKGYDLVYQGGHHNVYCNKEKHILTNGGTCHSKPDSFHIKREFNCDCKNYG